MPKRVATLVPYEHYEWGKKTLIWVDKANPSPDPSKTMLWGRGCDGEVKPGDFKRQFKRIGNPLEVRYSTEGCRTHADEQSRRIVAIKRAIKQQGCKR